MKTTGHRLFALVASVFLFASPTVWASPTSEFEAFLGQCRSTCSTAKNPFQFYGWMEGGITLNNHGNTNKYSTAPNLAPASRNQDPLSGNSYLFMTEQQSDLKLNQLWLGMSKGIDTTHGFDWGFQGDFLYGTDAKYTQNFGDRSFDHDWGQGDYYASIVQLYGEVGYGKLKFKMGKFAPGMFYEAVPAVASFFYSHAYLCYNTPLTVNGAVAEYKVNDCLSFTGGWTAGYHSSFDNRFGDNAFLGGVTLKTSRATSLRYNIFCNDTHGDTNPIYNRTTYNSGTELIQTLIFTYNINRCWLYMIEGLYVDNDFDTYSANAYGVNQHLIYTICPKWSVGLRGEWHHTDAGTLFSIPPVTGTPQNGDLYAVTFGANWNVCPKVMIRPEMRYDWAEYGAWKPFGNGTKGQQLSGGASMVVKF